MWGGGRGGPHRAAGPGGRRREMRLPAGRGGYVNRCTMTALRRLASFRVWLSSASSLFGKVVMRTKLVAAMAGRASTMKSRMSLILVERGVSGEVGEQGPSLLSTTPGHPSPQGSQNTHLEAHQIMSLPCLKPSRLLPVSWDKHLPPYCDPCLL